MFIFWSTGHDPEYFDLESQGIGCEKCGSRDEKVLMKDKFTVKLFFFIPIFWHTSYYIVCPYCGKRTKISKQEAMDLLNAEDQAMVDSADYTVADSAEAPQPAAEQALAEEQPAEEQPAEQQNAEQQNAEPAATRKIYLKRLKRYPGGAVPVEIYFDNQPFCMLKNGKEAEIETTTGAHTVQVRVTDSQSTWRSQPIEIAPSEKDETIEIFKDWTHAGFQVKLLDDKAE